MSKTLQAVRGMNDVLPDAADRWLFVDPLFVPLLVALQDRLDCVAGFADDSSSADQVVLGPVFRGDRTGVEADRDGQRGLDVGEEVANGGGER